MNIYCYTQFDAFAVGNPDDWKPSSTSFATPYTIGDPEQRPIINSGIFEQPYPDTGHGHGFPPVAPHMQWTVRKPEDGYVVMELTPEVVGKSPKRRRRHREYRNRECRETSRSYNPIPYSRPYNDGFGSGSYEYNGLYNEQTPSFLYPSHSSIYGILPIPTNIGDLVSLMSSAHQDLTSIHRTNVLMTIQNMLMIAERVPFFSRTDIQNYLLKYWCHPSYRLNNRHLPLVAYTDASRWGIGLFIPSTNQSFAWSWVGNHPRIPRGANNEVITSWAELIAVEVSLHTLFMLDNYPYTPEYYTGRRPAIVILSDNRGVVDALSWGNWTPRYGLHETIWRILRTCDACRIDLDVRWIPTKSNLADGPSRGKFGTMHGSTRIIKWWEMKRRHNVHPSGRLEEVPEHLIGIVKPVGEHSLL